jgi:MFS family permease
MEESGIIRFKKKFFDTRKQVMRDPRVMIYFLVFIYTLHITPASYISSSFLEQFTGKGYVGYVYSIGSILTIGAIVLARRSLQFFGNFKTFMSMMTVNVLTLLILTYSLFVEPTRIWGVIFVAAFTIGFIVRTVAFLCIDVFLEHYSSDEDTGGIRGLFLTSLNIAFVLGPLVAGVLITDTSNAARVYGWASIFAVIVMLLSYKYFRNFQDSKYEKSEIIKTLFKISKNKDLYRIFMSNLILRIFYALMIIYTPIFLTTHIGFGLGQVGLIMSIALLPFIMLQIPLGNLADDKFGEKEILTIGFIVTALATLSIAFVNVKIFALWAFILFMTRVGASAIEIMTETYLFKKIDDDDINILGLYRVVRPIAYIVSPVLASLFLLKFNISIIFIFLSVVLLYGIRYSLTLKDTL